MAGGEGLVRLIQKTAQGAIKSAASAELLAGVVASTTPTTVVVEDRLTLGEANLILSPLCHPNIKSLPSGGELTIWPGLRKGDSVWLLRKGGGKQYYILGKEGEI